MMLKELPFADILKISIEEFEFLTDSSNLEEGTEMLCDQYGIALVVVTLGKDGSFYRVGNKKGYNKAFKVDCVDTTGAGDAFLSGILHGILELDVHPSLLTEEDLEKMTTFANGLAALSTTKRGAIPSMPNQREVEAFISERRK